MATNPSDRHALLIEANRSEYGESYARIPFIDPASCTALNEQRLLLLDSLSSRIEVGCGGTKFDMNDLAPGCRVCVAGDWSCLFVNGRCNARCFYCPTSQEETGLPTTNAVSFRSPGDYVAYLEQFGFRGMSLSGGEPLLTPGRSLAFLGAAKRHFGDRLHTWLYTNGIMVDENILCRLRDAGLDEIRFYIGAVGYSLEKLRLAVGIIPTVTVEIPAVPEDFELTCQKMNEMAEIGVGYLNLHQLRLTPHNLERFMGRPYTFLHVDKATVLESELTALALLRHSLDEDLALPVNYCSFVYKNRYQRSAARRRSAIYIRKPYETVTSAGYLRTLAVAGDGPGLANLQSRFADRGIDPALWSLTPNGQRMLLAPELLAGIDGRGLKLFVSYAECLIREHASCRHQFKEFRLPSGRKIVVERWLAQEFALDGDARDTFIRRYLHHGNNHQDGLSGAETGFPMEIDACECIVEGLQDYF